MPSDKRETPPQGVPAQDSWDPDTGVIEVPRGPSVRRTPTGASAKRALEKIEELGGQLKEHAEIDKEALDKINEKLDSHSETLIVLRETSAATNATLTAMTSELRHTRRLELVKTEADAKVEIETARTERTSITWRYKVIVAVIGLMGTGLGALAHWLAK